MIDKDDLSLLGMFVETTISAPAELATVVETARSRGPIAWPLQDAVDTLQSIINSRGLAKLDLDARIAALSSEANQLSHFRDAACLAVGDAIRRAVSKRQNSDLQLRLLSQLSPDYEGREALIVAHWNVFDDNDRYEIVGIREADGALRVRHVMNGTKTILRAHDVYVMTLGAAEFVAQVVKMWELD